MFFRYYNLLIFVLLLTACQPSPHSKWFVYMPVDDELSEQEKIKLFTAGSTDLSSSGLAALARLYESQMAWSRALSAIKLAIEEDPMNSSYHSLKANYAYELGQKSVAYREALTAYQLGSKSLQQSLDLAKMAVALSEFSIVNNIIDSLLVAYPEDLDVLYMAARKYDMNGNTKLARKYYQKVNRNHPDHEENTIYYSLFLINRKELVLAKNVLEQSKNENLSRRYCLLRGDVHYGLNQLDSAVLFYKQALIKSADTTTFNLILNIYSLAENYDSLISIGEAATLAYPDNKKYLLITARSLDKKYLYEEALPHYLTLYAMDTLDTLVAAELSYLQRKIAYLQRKKEEQKKLADSLNNVLPDLTF